MFAKARTISLTKRILRPKGARGKGACRAFANSAPAEKGKEHLFFPFLESDFRARHHLRSAHSGASPPSTEQRLFGAVPPCGEPDKRRPEALVLYRAEPKVSRERSALRFISSLTFGDSLPGTARTALKLFGASGTRCELRE